jgi:hypothetical protein
MVLREEGGKGREERSKRAQELECDDKTVERRGERRRVIG